MGVWVYGLGVEQLEGSDRRVEFVGGCGAEQAMRGGRPAGQGPIVPGEPAVPHQPARLMPVLNALRNLIGAEQHHEPHEG